MSNLSFKGPRIAKSRKHWSKNGKPGDGTGLKVAPGGPIELQVGPPGDFDLADLILRVLEAWELGNKGLYRKYRAYNKNHENLKILFWSWESEKSIFTIFPEIFYEKMGWNTGITSETTGAWESRVRRRAPGNHE